MTEQTHEYNSMKSESIAALAKALSKAQAEMPPAPLNAVNPFFKSKYADLGSITKTAKPILAKHGLAVSQLTVSFDAKVGIETILMHESGEWISQIITLPLMERKGTTLVQMAGTVISYLRRYSLASALGIYAGDDVDGAEPTTTDEKVSVSTTEESTEEESVPKGKMWPGYMVSALVEEGLAQHPKNAVNILNLFPDLSRNTSKEKIVALVQIYRARKDDNGLSTSEAAEIAWKEWNE